MKIADLKKGIEYALPKASWDTDIRRVDRFDPATYRRPAEPVYDRWNPKKKLNAGDVIVTVDGLERTVNAKELVLPWAELVERAKDYLDASAARTRYEEQLQELVAEIGVDAIVCEDRFYGYSHDEHAGRRIHLSFSHGSADKFEPNKAQVRMPAELFRKLLQGVKA